MTEIENGVQDPDPRIRSVAPVPGLDLGPVTVNEATKIRNDPDQRIVADQDQEIGSLDIPIAGKKIVGSIKVFLRHRHF